MLRFAVLVFVSGCASVGPLFASPGGYTKSNADQSKVERCGTRGYIVGMAIDSVVVAGDLLVGSEIDGLDALVLAPFVIDAVFGTVMTLQCLSGD